MCHCIAKIEAELAPGGHRLHTTSGLLGQPRRALISLTDMKTGAIERRLSQPRSVVAKHCPWCGEKYEEGASHEQ